MAVSQRGGVKQQKSIKLFLTKNIKIHDLCLR